MDEGAVDLQHREMQRLQVRERAQASAEVIEREAPLLSICTTKPVQERRVAERRARQVDGKVEQGA
jgi:hypothetical protein